MRAPRGIGLELTVAAFALAFAGVLVHASARVPEPVQAAPQQLQTSAQVAPAGSNNFSPGPRAGN